MAKLERSAVDLSGMKAVIYDMDDLMVNSGPLHAQSWDITLKRYDKSIEDLPEAIRSDFVGRRVIDIEKTIIEAHKCLNSDKIPSASGLILISGAEICELSMATDEETIFQ